MSDKSIDIYNKFGRFSFWLAIFGLFCYMLYFPQGIYYCFFCGVMAVALACSARKNSPGSHSIGGIVMGIADVCIASVAFYGLYILYASLRDPAAAAEINDFLSRYLSEYGISLEMFSKILR